MIRRLIVLGVLCAVSTGCDSRDKQEAARILTPGPPPPVAVPEPPRLHAKKPPGKVRPPAPPRLTAPK